MNHGFNGAARTILAAAHRRAVAGRRVASSSGSSCVRPFQTSRYQEEPSSSPSSASSHHYAIASATTTVSSWMAIHPDAPAAAVAPEDNNPFDPSNFGYRVVDPLASSSISPRFSSLYEEDYDQYSLHMAPTRGSVTSCRLHPVAASAATPFASDSRGSKCANRTSWSTEDAGAA